MIHGCMISGDYIFYVCKYLLVRVPTSASTNSSRLYLLTMACVLFST